MRNMVGLAFSLLLIDSAFARTVDQPVRHRRYSQNNSFFVDFNPETNRHVVFAADEPDRPVWSFHNDAFWPPGKDESDGSLFVADDGRTIAGPTWIHWSGYPPDYRVFDGLEFWNANGRIASYQLSELPSWRLKVLDLPVRVVWQVIHKTKGRGRLLERRGDQLHETTFGMRSFTFSMNTGEVTGWNLNLKYAALFVLVYVPPMFVFVRAIIRRVRRPLNKTETCGACVRRFVVRNAGSLLVLLNAFGFASGVFLDSFGGAADRFGALLCRLTYPSAFVLIPVVLIISIAGVWSRPRRFDILGPWLAIMAALLCAAGVS